MRANSIPDIVRWLCICGVMLLVPAGWAAEDLPPIPVGMDTYRLWDRWANQRIGMRAYMRSTYDRRGGNEGADASHFLYQLSDSMNVTLDLEGSGVLVFSRYNHWHGSPWHYIVDGTDRVMRRPAPAILCTPRPIPLLYRRLRFRVL